MKMNDTRATMEHQMTPTVICIWVMVFTSSMLCVETTVTSRYTNCRFNVTDLGCPVYDYTDWDCLKYEASCPKGTDYHCLRLHSEHSRYADGCARSEECSKGEVPYWALIHDGIPAHVICDWCHNIEYFNPDKKLSSTYSHCPFKKVKCDYYNGIECLPENKNDIYKQDRLCRCDARNNYVFGDLKRLKGQVCTSDQFLTTDCIHAEPCKDGQERLLNYTCVNKCKNGFRSNTSDECQRFFFIQPQIYHIIEPTEKTGEPFPTAQSRNTKERTTSSTISSRKISSSSKATITSKVMPTLKSEVIQTTTKLIQGHSTSISTILLSVICALLILLIGIGVVVCRRRRLLQKPSSGVVWQCKRYNQKQRKSDQKQHSNAESFDATTPFLSQERKTVVENDKEREKKESSPETERKTVVENDKEREKKESSPETGPGTSGDSAREETANPTVGESKPVKTVVQTKEESEKKESSPETATEQDSDATLRLDQKRTQLDPTIGSTPITGPSQALSPSIPAADLEFVVEPLPDLQPKSPLEIIATEQDSDSTLRLDQKRTQSDPTIGSTPITGPSQALSPSIPATDLEFVDKPLPDLQPKSPHVIVATEQDSDATLRLDQKRTQSDPTIGSTPITGPSQALSPSIPAADLEFVVELLPDLQPKSPLEIIATEQDSDSTLRLDQKRIQSDPTIGSTPITGSSQALSPSIPTADLEFVVELLPDLQPKSPLEIIDKKHHSNFHNRMAEPRETLYRNWLKAGRGLLYVKEGIQDFIVEEIEKLHSSVLVGAGRCTIHTIENVLRCPTKGFCSPRSCRVHDITDPGKTYTPCPSCEAIRKKIKEEHRYGLPSYKNTTSKLWCTDSWELAKCFMPAHGYSDKNTADVTDLSGLISVILNSKTFQDKITENLGHPGNKFEKVKKVRNDVMHNAKMQIPTTDLNSYFDILHDVLNDSKYLQHLTKVKDVKDKLHQLQNNVTTITANDIQMVVNEAQKALERHTEECVYKINKSKEECFYEIKKTTEDSIQKIVQMTYESIQDITRVIEDKMEEHCPELQELIPLFKNPEYKYEYKYKYKYKYRNK